MVSEPSVAIIVLNWNGRLDTLACLSSLQRLRYPNHHVIVVDNGSTDGSVLAIREAYPAVTLIEAGDNLGYVGGNNLGLERAAKLHDSYALLLNNDTEVDPDFLSHLVAAVEAEPSAAMAGPTIYYHSQPQRVWSAGGEIDWKSGNTFMKGIGLFDDGQFGSCPRPVDFVTGCALLVRMSVVYRMGGLDPRFYAYYEETEWCVRARRLGFTILHVPTSKLWHKISPEGREASPQVQYYMTRNHLLFLKLSHASLQTWLSQAVEFATRLASWTLRPRWRGKAPLRDATLRAILDFSRGRYGRVDLRPRAGAR